MRSNDNRGSLQDTRTVELNYNALSIGVSNWSIELECQDGVSEIVTARQCGYQRIGVLNGWLVLMGHRQLWAVNWQWEVMYSLSTKALTLKQ